LRCARASWSCQRSTSAGADTALSDRRRGRALFGYVGEIQDQQLGRPEFAGLDVGAQVGQSGVERIYNAKLQGSDGRRNVVVNSVGREIEPLGQDDPIEGARMQLSIDYDLQKALEDAFRFAGLRRLWRGP
jgi:penicillin-binding protein 2